MQFKNTLFSIFKISHTLRVTYDPKKGTPIVFLHGIASDSSTWQNVLPLLPETYRPITIDLLGFGESPKPSRNNYSTRDHAKAVIKTIKKLGIQTPVVIVGHSMGSLIAVEVARRRPDIVKSLIMVSAPLYTNSEIKQARLQGPLVVTNVLFSLYKRIILHEKLSLRAAQALMKLSPNAATFTLDKDTWLPFKKSLQNTIMNQTTLTDIPTINKPMQLIYGRLDMLVIAKHYIKLANNSPSIETQSYTGGHMITLSGAKKIVRTIQAIE